MTEPIFKANLMPALRSMLSNFTTALVLILAMGSYARAADPLVDVVFDLDWTLISTTTDKMAQAAPEGLIEVDGVTYRFTDHAFDVLTELQSQPDVRISFFSGGKAERNQQVIKIIYDEIHKRTGNTSLQPYKVLSFDNLTEISNDPRMHFSERYKKISLATLISAEPC